MVYIYIYFYYTDLTSKDLNFPTAPVGGWGAETKGGTYWK